jgi:DNA polymerase-3 subunit delta'
MPEIIGHAPQRRFLEAVREKGTVAHAYLFSGPSSVGKSTVAASFIADLVGLRSAAADPADPWSALRNYPDFTILEREEDAKTGKRRKNISIEQIRTLRQRLGLGSFLSSWKIGVIPEAETLSADAANALLKMLEEPAGQTLMLLTTSSLSRVPLTVRSRCQIVRFQLVPDRDIREGLERRGLARERAEEISPLAAGRPGAAIALAEAADLAERDAEAASAFVSVLGEPVWRKIATAGATAPERGTGDAAGETERMLRVWESVLRDALVVSAGEPALVRRVALRTPITLWARGREPRGIARALVALGEARAALRENVSPRLALEHVLLALS